MLTATVAVNATIADAHDVLVSALRFHLYQHEAYSEYGVDHPETPGENARNIASQARYASQCYAALIALVGPVLAAEERSEAAQAASRRVHGD